MSAEFQYDVFLSHKSDKPRVRWLSERVCAANLQQTGFGSPQQAAWVGRKRSTVGRGNLPLRDPTDAGHRFISFLLADCGLPDALRRYKYADYRKDTQVAFDEPLSARRAASARRWRTLVQAGRANSGRNRLPPHIWLSVCPIWRSNYSGARRACGSCMRTR